jgi:hypothetical protein
MEGSGMRTRRPVRKSELFAGLEALEPRVVLSGNGGAPTAGEQLLLEYLNRFRMDPAGELGRMVSNFSPITSPDAEVTSALRFFNVSGSLLQSQWAELTPAQPLAWNIDLAEAADYQSQSMIDTDTQAHELPGRPDLRGRAEAGRSTGATGRVAFRIPRVTA